MAQLPYYDVLAKFPFKGDEHALRSMEHVELISIGTVNGKLRSFETFGGKLDGNRGQAARRPYDQESPCLNPPLRDL